MCNNSSTVLADLPALMRERLLPPTEQMHTQQAACILKLKLSCVTEIILQNIKLNMQMDSTEYMSSAILLKSIDRTSPAPAGFLTLLARHEQHKHF
jgi:hypothetical protein